MGDIQDLEKTKDNDNSSNYDFEEMKECLCRIENKNGKGLGFFCLIPVQNNNLKVMITTNSIINEDILKNDKIIEIIMKYKVEKEQIKRIYLYDKRKVYTSIKYDITIIEIYPENDNIHKYLKINNKIFQQMINFEKIYIIQYISDKKKIKQTKSKGVINQINDYNLKYSCNFSESLPGCPILDISNNEVIGMHKESLLNFNNNGILLKEPLTNYINDIVKINSKNEINIKIRIEEKDINKTIYFVYGQSNFVGSYNNKGVYSSFCPIGSEKIINIFNNNNTNVELFINNIKYDYTTCFQAEEEGIYDVKLKFLTKIDNCCKLFCGCKNIIYIDLSFFDSSNITDTSFMFANCYNLEKINFSSFDTKNVIDMSYMFINCSKLTNLNLSFFNTKNVRKMNSMFYGCVNLNDLYLSSFDTHNVTEFNSMFAYCMNLSNLDLSSFDTSSLKEMNSMFYKCYSLSNINLSCFDGIAVIKANNIFDYCYNLSLVNLNCFKSYVKEKKETQDCVNLLF